MSDSEATDTAAAAIAAAISAEAEARRQLVILVADIGWLIGAADQAGIVAPAKIHDHLEAAVHYLGAVPA